MWDVMSVGFNTMDVFPASATYSNRTWITLMWCRWQWLWKPGGLRGKERGEMHPVVSCRCWNIYLEQEKMLNSIVEEKLEKEMNKDGDERRLLPLSQCCFIRMYRIYWMGGRNGNVIDATTISAFHGQLIDMPPPPFTVYLWGVIAMSSDCAELWQIRTINIRGVGGEKRGRSEYSEHLQPLKWSVINAYVCVCSSVCLRSLHVEIAAVFRPLAPVLSVCLCVCLCV